MRSRNLSPQTRSQPSPAGLLWRAAGRSIWRAVCIGLILIAFAGLTFLSIQWATSPLPWVKRTPWLWAISPVVVLFALWQLMHLRRVNALSPRSPPKAEVRALVRAIALIVIGVLFVGLVTLATAQDGRAHDRLRSTPAVLLAKELFQGGGHDAGPIFWGILRYKIDGVQHTSTGNALRASNTRGAAAQLIDRYAVGGTYAVWYDPANPAFATLNRGDPPSRPVGFVALGAGLVVVGLIGAIVVTRRSSRAEVPSADGILPVAGFIASAETDRPRHVHT